MAELTNIKRAVEQWRRDGVKLLPPHDEAAVIDRLTSLGRLVSRDVVELYCATGGMDSDMDTNHLSLWPLAGLTPGDTPRDYPLLLFADFLINSHLYGLKYENAEESSVYAVGEGEPERVADSLDEFFSHVLNDPRKVWM